MSKNEHNLETFTKKDSVDAVLWDLRDGDVLQVRRASTRYRATGSRERVWSEMLRVVKVKGGLVLRSLDGARRFEIFAYGGYWRIVGSPEGGPRGVDRIISGVRRHQLPPGWREGAAECGETVLFSPSEVTLWIEREGDPVVYFGDRAGEDGRGVLVRDLLALLRREGLA